MWDAGSSLEPGIAGHKQAEPEPGRVGQVAAQRLDTQGDGRKNSGCNILLCVTLALHLPNYVRTSGRMLIG